MRSVAQMGSPELVSEWRAQFGAPPPPKLRVEFMRPILVYRIQENALGSRRRNGKPDPGLGADANRRRFKTRTKIIREWKDKIHEVGVTAEGYAYKGEIYKSLRRSRFGSPAPSGQDRPSSAKAKEGDR